MKRKIIIFLFCFINIFYFSYDKNIFINNLNNYNIQNLSNKFICDTIKILNLKDYPIYKGNKYVIVYGISCDKKYEKRIFVLKNDNIISTIYLPSEEEVKNFGVNKISEIYEGFSIYIDAGGGNYFYNRELNFRFINDKFYFIGGSLENYIWDIDSIYCRSIKVKDPIELDSFYIMEYLVW